MIHDQLIAFVLQPDKFPHGCGDFDHPRQVVLAKLGHYFIHAFLIGIPTARARRTGEAMGCLVSSQEQHPPPLQSFNARVVIERVVAITRLVPGC